MCMGEYVEVVDRIRARDKRELEEKQKEKNKLNDFMSHFPKFINEPSKELKELVEDKILKKRYLFIWKEKNKQYGMCSNCGEKVKLEGVQHKQVLNCPKCGREVEARYKGYPRKNLYRGENIIWYEKSHKDKNVVIARAMQVSLDHTHTASTKKCLIRYFVLAAYKFEIGKSEMIKRNYWSPDFYFCDIQNPECGQFPKQYLERNVEGAIKDTPFKYYDINRYCEYFYKKLGFFSKYPRIDTLEKCGFGYLIDNKFSGNRSYSSINWNGDSLYKILKINRQDYKRITEEGIKINERFLRLFQINKAQKGKLTVKDIEQIAMLHSEDIYGIIAMSKYVSINKSVKYIEWQYTKENISVRKEKAFWCRSQITSTWKDYINDCKELKMDLKDERVILPKNLYKAHQNTIKKIKVKKNSIYDEKIKDISKMLNKKYYFEDEEMFIRAAISTEDMIAEGNENDNCVASNYTKSYAQGRTAIMFVRRKEQPDKSYITVEIKNKRIIQARAKHNLKPDDRALAFLDKFKVEKLGGVKA